MKTTKLIQLKRGILSAILLTATANLTSAALPAQADVFAIVSHTPAETNFVSSDYIFAALPFYEEVKEGYASDYPSHKSERTQQGVIVLNDKSVLFFDTRSSKYLSVQDSSNHHTFYRLAKTPPVKKGACPKAPVANADLPFPKPDDVFCVAMFPWNQGRHFTARSLTDALPLFRPVTAEDVPKLALVSYNEKGTKLFVPNEFSGSNHTSESEPLNGVLVLKNRAVLKWITWTPKAIAFANYRPQTYFIIDSPKR